MTHANTQFRTHTRSPHASGPAATMTGPIANLVLRDMAARSQPSQRLAAVFQAMVVESEAFSWMGVAESFDREAGVPAIDVYLAEREPLPEDRECFDRVAEAFADLTLSLRPSAASHLHVVAASALPELQRSLRKPTGDADARRLVAEYPLQP